MFLKKVKFMKDRKNGNYQPQHVVLYLVSLTQGLLTKVNCTATGFGMKHKSKMSNLAENFCVRNLKCRGSLVLFCCRYEAALADFGFPCKKLH